MAQRVGLINALVSATQDKDFGAILDALTPATGFVIDGGLAVTTGLVAAGRCLVQCTRTSTTPNGVVWAVFENTAAVTIDTTGTKKVWVGINQANIDDATQNIDVNGLNIGSIQTGAAYPASNFVPLASIVGGVITDERATISLRNVKRKGMTAKRVIITDASGNETELSGTSGQVVGFDAGGAPVAITHSVVVDTPFKASVGSYFFGDGSDGDLTVSSGTTTLTATSDEVFKQYNNLTVSWTGILACAGKINHIYVAGTFTISSGSIHANGYGWAGWVWPTTATTNWSNGTNGNGMDWATVSGRDFYAWALTNASANGGVSNGWAGGAGGTFKANERGRMIRVAVGAGGGSSGSPYNTAGAGGSGGGGGGVLIIIANVVNITGGTISANGGAWSAGSTANRGGGGGGGWGTIVMLYGNLVADTGTWQCNGGNGWNGNGGGWYSTATGWAGGGGGFWIAGWNGANWVIGGGAGSGGTPANNSYWNGGTGGTGAWGGGGGGGAPGVYYKAKARIN